MTSSAPRWLVTWAAVALLTGCAANRDAAGYYWQSVNGHIQVMRAARPIDQVLAAPETPVAVRNRLQLAKRMRAFAVHTLGLPDNASYTRYADIKRLAVIWNVVAAPALALGLRTWCFPVAGCIGYRGYFLQADAQALANTLQAEGLDVSVYGVPAYSTLGWMNWAGGDPLLNTFLGYGEGNLAQLLFHELAHQVAYAPDDTMFNESFATMVEQRGAAQWLATESTAAARAEFASSQQRHQQFQTLTFGTRKRLADIYATNTALAAELPTLLAMKKEALTDFRAEYAQLRARWGGDPARWAGYDRWVASANNASFATQAAYNALVPEFESLFAHNGGDWPRFYDAVRHLARLPPKERLAALNLSAASSAPQPAAVPVTVTVTASEAAAGSAPGSAPAPAIDTYGAQAAPGRSQNLP